MKTCPTCNRTYTDASLNFCLEDGTPLAGSPASGIDPNATIRYTDPRDTRPPVPVEPPVKPPVDRPVEPPVNQRPVAPTYQMSPPVAGHGSSFGQPQSAMPVPGRPAKKSNALWWILGGALVLGVIVVGVAVMILALASMGSNSNVNANRANANSRVPVNRNANTNANSNLNTNANANLPSSLTDDFSVDKWGTGTYSFGDIWYADGQYHMRSKDKTYLVMYAPSDYRTSNATVRVTARSVDGTPAQNGFGLIVHGQRSKANELEDYALLIYTGAEAKYEIIKHKGGEQSALVPWTKSTVIRGGTNTNQLEVRARGPELTFYINGQYVDRITDTENFRRGVAGLYTSDTAEVAFDDLEIKR